VLAGLGKPDDSFQEFKKAVKLEPSQPIYLLMLGNAYLMRGMPKEAVQVLEEAEKLQPQNPALLHQLALGYEKNGQKDLAAQTQARALALVEAARPAVH
jgi:predicted Zn-dependent protease